jgi:hypothetical protein
MLDAWWWTLRVLPKGNPLFIFLYFIQYVRDVIVLCVTDSSLGKWKSSEICTLCAPSVSRTNCSCLWKICVCNTCVYWLQLLQFVSSPLELCFFPWKPYIPENPSLEYNYQYHVQNMAKVLEFGPSDVVALLSKALTSWRRLGSWRCGDDGMHSISEEKWSMRIWK